MRERGNSRASETSSNLLFNDSPISVRTSSASSVANKISIKSFRAKESASLCSIAKLVPAGRPVDNIDLSSGLRRMAAALIISDIISIFDLNSQLFNAKWAEVSVFVFIIKYSPKFPILFCVLHPAEGSHRQSIEDFCSFPCIVRNSLKPILVL